MTTLTLSRAVSELILQGIPVDSPTRAAQHINGLITTMSITPAQAQAFLQQLTGETVVADAGAHALLIPYVYGYLVQNVVKAHVTRQAAEMVALLVKSRADAARFIEQNSWSFVAPEDARGDIENVAPEIVIAGMAKKGARKVLGLKVFTDHIQGKKMTRKEAISVLMEKVGLTLAGASTYYANFKSGKWV